MNHPKPWLRYIEADKLDDNTLDLDGMNVQNGAGEKLGDVDGFIVDSESGRTYYAVVDAPGWFTSKQFLLPIGQLHLNDDRDALVVNLTKEQVKRFPGFDKDEFDKLTESDITRINNDICLIVEQDVVYSADEPYYEAWNRRSFQYPDWWTAEPTLPNRMGGSAFEKGVEYPPAPARKERVPKYVERSEAHDANDPSPHFDGRAQPGDVIGVETGGEQTHMGETKEDENKRREDAEKAARK